MRLRIRSLVKNTLMYGTFIVTISLTMMQLPKALDQNYYEQYEKPAQYLEEVKRERLNQILEDNIIDETEKAEYKELTREEL